MDEVPEVSSTIPDPLTPRVPVPTPAPAPAPTLTVAPAPAVPTPAIVATASAAAPATASAAAPAAADAAAAADALLAALPEGVALVSDASNRVAVRSPHVLAPYVSPGPAPLRDAAGASGSARASTSPAFSFEPSWRTNPTFALAGFHAVVEIGAMTVVSEGEGGFSRELLFFCLDAPGLSEDRFLVVTHEAGGVASGAPGTWALLREAFAQGWVISVAGMVSSSSSPSNGSGSASGSSSASGTGGISVRSGEPDVVAPVGNGDGVSASPGSGVVEAAATRFFYATDVRVRRAPPPTPHPVARASPSLQGQAQQQQQHQSQHQHQQHSQQPPQQQLLRRFSSEPLAQQRRGPNPEEAGSSDEDSGDEGAGSRDMRGQGSSGGGSGGGGGGINNTRVIVQGLPMGFSPVMLRELLAPFALADADSEGPPGVSGASAVSNISIIDQGGVGRRPRTTGFASFSTRAQAELCIRRLNGLTLASHTGPGRAPHLVVAFAEPSLSSSGSSATAAVASGAAAVPSLASAAAPVDARAAAAMAAARSSVARQASVPPATAALSSSNSTCTYCYKRGHAQAECRVRLKGERMERERLRREAPLPDGGAPQSSPSEMTPAAAAAPSLVGLGGGLGLNLGLGLPQHIQMQAQHQLPYPPLPPPPPSLLQPPTQETPLPQHPSLALPFHANASAAALAAQQQQYALQARLVPVGAPPLPPFEELAQPQPGELCPYCERSAHAGGVTFCPQRSRDFGF